MMSALLLYSIKSAIVLTMLYLPYMLMINSVIKLCPTSSGLHRKKISVSYLTFRDVVRYIGR